MPRRVVATDFFGYFRPSECELRVWLRAAGVEESPPGPFAKLLMRLGQEHEERHLKAFPVHLDLGGGSIAERALSTREAVARGEPVIYQGALRAQTQLGGEQVEVVGVPDFLILTPFGYAIRDSKLARRISRGHPEIELQLELYGWLYEQTFRERPVSLQVHNGVDEIAVIPYQGGGPALAMLERIIGLRTRADPPPLAVGWSKCSGCGYFGRCWPEAEKARDVGLLPGVDLGLASELRGMGAGTIQSLRTRFDVSRLAGIERPWGRKRMKVGEVVSRRVLAGAQAFDEGRPVILSEPAIAQSPNYVMFDLEGMPPQLDELEKVYLWGLQVFGERTGPFRGALAEAGPKGDAHGWEAFLRESESLLGHHGEIPFVHWGSYERSKLDLYIDRHGDPEGTAERVKANLLDLLPITQEAVALPLPSYSLKLVEGVVGFERTLDEYGGDWSMARYIEATETSDEGLREQIIEEILAYNREDLEATWAVLCWLRSLPGRCE
ncbi:MAG: TM0106 family RecB-like putative nuclease [Actinomycetota bacterium]